MKRILAMILIGLQPFITAYLAGMEFVTGSNLAFLYVLTLVVSGGVYFYPGWDEGTKP